MINNYIILTLYGKVDFQIARRTSTNERWIARSEVPKNKVQQINNNRVEEGRDRMIFSPCSSVHYLFYFIFVFMENARN